MTARVRGWTFAGWPLTHTTPHHTHNCNDDDDMDMDMDMQPGRRSTGGSGGVKVGSFQEYVRHDFVVEDLSPSLLPLKEVGACLHDCLRVLCLDGWMDGWMDGWTDDDGSPFSIHPSIHPSTTPTKQTTKRSTTTTTTIKQTPTGAKDRPARPPPPQLGPERGQHPRPPAEAAGDGHGGHSGHGGVDHPLQRRRG